MIHRIRRILARLLFKILPFDYILQEYAIRKEFENKRLVKMDSEGQFTATASVFNFSSEPGKISVGKGTVVEGELLIFNYGGQIRIGTDSYIGKNSVVWSGERIDIGSNVLISQNVNVSDTSAHEFDYLERAERFRELLKTGHPKVKASIQTAPIIIEDYVWINPYCIIIKGVRVGKGAIVASGSVVTDDVAPFTMVAGNPARKVRDLAHS